MQTLDKTTGFMFFLCTLVIFAMYFSNFLYKYNKIYSTITVEVSKSKKLEYGSANYNIVDVLDKVSGNVVSVVRDVNINKIGEQKVVLEVKKSSITKEVPVIVEVVDSIAPVISLKEDVININSGTKYDVFSNILSVTDTVDGELKYKSFDDVKENETNYYTIIGSVNTNVVGNNTIEIKAVDKTGNVTLKKFDVKVNSHGRGKTLSSIAYSLVGSAYVSGGNGPSGFDCSGFVQYVYARAGLKVSRSASTQLYDGYEVSYSDAKAGDIIVWGYGRDSITHTAIYVGNGLMVHAANPSEGVVVNNANSWGKWSGVHIVSVRRLS